MNLFECSARTQCARMRALGVACIYMTRAQAHPNLLLLRMLVAALVCDNVRARAFTGRQNGRRLHRMPRIGSIAASHTSECRFRA